MLDGVMPTGSTTRGRASSSGSCGSGAASRPTCSSATTSATATSATTASGRTTPSRSSRSPTPSRSASAARSTGSTSRSQGDRVDVSLLRDARRSCRCGPRRGSTSACSTSTTASWAPRPASSPRSASSTTSASPPTAGGAAIGRRTSTTLRRAPPRGHASRSQPSRRATQPFEWPAGWERVPDEDWTHEPVDDFGAAYDNVDHHGWYRNLDPTVEELAHLLERRRHPDRLLGRHRHPARPPEAADVRHAGRRGHRRQLAEVPACRAREVPRRPEGRAAPAALPEGREAAAAARGGARPRAGRAGASTSSCRPTPSTSTPTWPTPSRRGCGCCARAATCSSTRATSATRGPARSEWILDETVWVVGDLAEGLVRTDPRVRRLRRRPRRRASG